jgi:phospholipid transport system substrate-binding protein
LRCGLAPPVREGKWLHIVTKDGKDVPIDYRLLKRGDRWWVYDVGIEGVSLVANYRTQFNNVVQTSSYEELLSKLRARAEELQAPR